MNTNDEYSEFLGLAKFIVKWGFIGVWVGVLSGSASALFLWLLVVATKTQAQYPALLFFLPLIGIGIVFIYTRYGKEIAGGNNLLLEQIHNPSGTVPFRMAPIIFITTVITHLFGGSAGREGTAVQMGGTLATVGIGRYFRTRDEIRIMLTTGIAAGFGSVFGTPLAGAIFGLEVLSIGRIRYDALLPSLVASIVGDFVCQAWGITHYHYVVALSPITPMLLGLAVVGGMLFAGASTLFSELTHVISHLGQNKPYARYAKPFIGGLIIIGLTLGLGTRDYNGLSLPLLERTFTGGEIPFYAFLCKIVLTSVTLGSGFKGGEVTPLFVIGATLGHTFAQLTGQPPALFAALGLAAVFAGAANTPLACTLMGIELFGAELALPLALACVTSYILSGHRGIYLAQQIGHFKHASAKVEQGITLRSFRVKKGQVPFANKAEQRGEPSHERDNES